MCADHSTLLANTKTAVLNMDRIPLDTWCPIHFNESYTFNKFAK